MSKYLIDSNVCIYFFRQFPEIIHYMQEIFQQPKNEMLISVITEAELLSIPTVCEDSGLKAEIIGIY